MKLSTQLYPFAIIGTVLALTGCGVELTTPSIDENPAPRTTKEASPFDNIKGARCRDTANDRLALVDLSATRMVEKSYSDAIVAVQVISTGVWERRYTVNLSATQDDVGTPPTNIVTLQEYGKPGSLKLFHADYALKGAIWNTTDIVSRGIQLSGCEFLDHVPEEM